MALSMGTGPFSDAPIGRFDVAPPPRPLLYWEPFPKRLRVASGGVPIVDSRRAVALHDTGALMRLLVPWADVKRDRLVRTEREDHARLGVLQAWTVDGTSIVGRSIEAPPSVAAALKDLVLLDLAAADTWHLEDDLGYAHPRDPYHRFDVQRSSREVVVRVGEARIARSNAPALLFETALPIRIYLPPDAVDAGVLVKSETVSQCPYKGDGQHWHVEVGGHRIVDAAWSLTTPMGDATLIPRWLSFYPEKVAVEVDGEVWT